MEEGGGASGPPLHQSQVKMVLVEFHLKIWWTVPPQEQSAIHIQPSFSNSGQSPSAATEPANLLPPQQQNPRRFSLRSNRTHTTNESPSAGTARNHTAPQDRRRGPPTPTSAGGLLHPPPRGPLRISPALRLQSRFGGLLGLPGDARQSRDSGPPTTAARRSGALRRVCGRAAARRSGALRRLCGRQRHAAAERYGRGRSWCCRGRGPRSGGRSNIFRRSCRRRGRGPRSEKHLPEACQSSSW